LERPQGRWLIEWQSEQNLEASFAEIRLDIFRNLLNLHENVLPAMWKKDLIET